MKLKSVYCDSEVRTVIIFAEGTHFPRVTINRVFSFVWGALKKESSPYRLQQIL